MSQTISGEDRTIAILRARTEGRTLDEIGARWGFTRERARQIVERGRKLVADKRASIDLRLAVAALDESEKARVAERAQAELDAARVRSSGIRDREEWERAIADRYRSGESCVAIAKDLGVVYTTVTSIIKRRGGITYGPGNPKFDHERILAALKEGRPRDEIAAEFGCSTANVHVIARKHGLASSRFRNRALVVEALQSDRTLRQIAEDVGCSYSYVAKVSTSLGLHRKRSRTGRGAARSVDTERLANILRLLDDLRTEITALIPGPASS